MLRQFERLFTSPMIAYPYRWVGPQSEGVISQYCDLRHGGFRLNNQGPDKGELVFENCEDKSPAFKVTYSNKLTGRLRVKSTNLQARYNQALLEWVKQGREGVAPESSRISLEIVLKPLK